MARSTRYAFHNNSQPTWVLILIVNTVILWGFDLLGVLDQWDLPFWDYSICPLGQVSAIKHWLSIWNDFKYNFNPWSDSQWHGLHYNQAHAQIEVLEHLPICPPLHFNFKCNKWQSNYIHFHKLKVPSPPFCHHKHDSMLILVACTTDPALKLISWTGIWFRQAGPFFHNACTHYFNRYNSKESWVSSLEKITIHPRISTCTFSWNSCLSIITF